MGSGVDGIKQGGGREGSRAFLLSPSHTFTHSYLRKVKLSSSVNVMTLRE